MDTLRVTLFATNYDQVVDGVSLTLKRWVTFLINQKISVLIVTPKSKTYALRVPGRIVRTPAMPIPFRSEYFFATRLPNYAKKKIDKFKPHLIHIATPDVLGYKALLYARKRSLPVLTSYHTHFSSYLQYYGLRLVESLLWIYLRKFYNQCDGIYVPSDSIKTLLKDHGIRENVHLWERGIDRTLFNASKKSMAWRRKHGVKDDEIIILFVSRLVWEKGIGTIINVMKKVKKNHPKVHFFVAGDGVAKDKLKKELPHTQFLGYLQPEDLAQAYASSDIFFFPSITETFGSVTLEAMSCGLPCVVALANGSSALVQHGENGFLSDSKENEYIDYLEKLILDTNLRSDMQMNAMIKSRRYSWNKLNERLLSYYYEFINLKT